MWLCRLQRCAFLRTEGLISRGGPTWFKSSTERSDPRPIGCFQVMARAGTLRSLKPRGSEFSRGQPIFSATIGSSCTLERPKRTFRREFPAAGLPDLRLHDLRRTLGSWQAATGASLPIIGKSLGHKSLAATQIYARLDLDPVRASVNKATDAMLLAGEATALLEGGR